MGIKGLYRELGPGQRVSLSKLAADSFEASNRPFRVAIDVAIWQFQAQAARGLFLCSLLPASYKLTPSSGGFNPEIRTLFYRLVRLLGTPIQPIFVFDGPQKPRFKRNKWTGLGNGVTTAQAKRMMQLFGFATHDAPGEAEAECALLQKQGIVDAVLSEDVDTLMFGCTRMLRSWSAAEGRRSKTPTHVTLYDVHGEREESVPSLDAEGMILVALMSGGDYIPEGIPGCGIKVACEAAKAGFGRSLCRLKTSDEQGLRTWREHLTHELHSNENGHFRTKHPGLTVPDDFPNLEVLHFYTDPIVSKESSLLSARQDLMRSGSPRLDELRDFTRTSIGWDHRIGAIKFIRVLSQALLVHNICQTQGDVDGEDLVKRISARRHNFTTDGSPELRLAYVPSEVVPIDLTKESEEPVQGCDGQTTNGGGGGGDDEFFDADADGSKLTALRAFDITKPDLAWVLEDVARRRVPRAVEAWEQAEEAKLAKAVEAEAVKAARAANRAKSKTGMPRGALDSFVRVTKASSATAAAPDGLKKQFDFLRPAPSPLPPEDISKPPRKGAAVGAAAVDKDGGSPLAPRLPKSNGRTETVQLSSSPSAPLSPQRRSRAGLPRVAGPGQHLPPTGRRKEVKDNDIRKKQTLMDSFVVGPGKKTTATMSKTRAAAGNDKEKKSSSFPEKQKTTNKKTLLTTRDGFVHETEMDEDERESKLQENGVAGRVALRLSDVSVIDLTGE
ncbi:hypothetical protein CP533_5685 [Ophiocordyceps camponoti-saundersi (nom. inval.)]|nr:hypothetical protein CP533_5685 [Ophiocordyceps camponoti-saundersi (nom. inval.)]